MAINDQLTEKELIRKSLEGIEENASHEYTTTFESESADDYRKEDRRSTQNTSTNKFEYTNLLIDNKISILETKIVEKISGLQSDLLGKYTDISDKISSSKPNYILIFLATIIGIVLAVVGLLFIIFPVYNENYWLTHKGLYINEIIEAAKKIFILKK